MLFMKYLSKLQRTRNIFFCLTAVFIVYITINQLFINWITNTEDKANSIKIRQDARNQIVILLYYMNMQKI